MKSKRGKNGRVVVVVACGVIIIGLACMIAGIVLMVKYSKIQKTESSSEKDVYTSEARKSGLNRLLEKLQIIHYELYPDRIRTKPHVTSQEVSLKYRPMELSPARLKSNTDTCRELLAEFEELRLTRKKLSIREKRALAVAKFWTKHIMPFGVPYGYDYYVGDWMLSPDVFCWVPICSFGGTFKMSINDLKPFNVDDMERVRDRLVDVNRTFSQYVENVKLGVEVGMVRNVEGCKAGFDGIKETFLNIVLYGAQGILNSTHVLPERFFETFLSNFEDKPEELETWRKKYGKSMNDSLKEYFVNHVGKPIHDMLRYFEFEHMQYCPTDDIVSGYKDLPVSFVYKNGTALRPTTKRLPNGELISGEKSYKKILNYFTSTDISPETINELGFELIEKYYNQVIQIAREVTGEQNSSIATKKFKKILKQDDMYFSEEAIPASESDKNAYKLCSTVEGAKKHCPVRWKAIQNWFTYSRQIIAALDAKIINLFHFAGAKHTTPNCPVGLSPIFNPSTAAQGYTETNDMCSYAATYDIPFFLKKLGPKYEEWSVCAHETRPGHHLQVMQAIRLIADSSFHSIGNLTRQQALHLKHKYLWDYSDIPVFNETVNPYQKALDESGYSHKLTFNPQPNERRQRNKNRKRNITWYNPPWDSNVKTNLGKKFLNAVDKCFPKDHPLHKIFNRHTLKLSYSCMPNMKTIIASHNKRTLSNATATPTQQRKMPPDKRSLPSNSKNGNVNRNLRWTCIKL
ncbi:hypothetical protein QZH41_004318 [Actinostola sp. cb2023]|nr:hypothetical protein QZH41_004318 [Actinostola sp. cb2023]